MRILRDFLLVILVILGLCVMSSFIEGRVYKEEGTAHRWQYIVIHHSATESGNAEEFDRYHRLKRGWDELAYHFVIGNGRGAGDGEIQIGSRWRKAKHGAHAGNKKMNDISIGICLVGNFEKSYPTKKQMESLIKLLRRLMEEYDIPASHIIGHNEVNMGKGKSTLCPGKNLNIEEIRRRLSEYE